MAATPALVDYAAASSRRHRGAASKSPAAGGERMPLAKKVTAELIGTFWLVLGGCGSAVLAARFPEIGIGLVGVSLAFGLTVLTMAYALGHISGGHFNPAVTVGLYLGRRMPAGDVVPYIVAQIVGAVAAAAVLYAIASGKPGFDLAGGFATNGYAEHSPGGYSLPACAICEVVMTAGFIFVIMGVTDPRAPAGFAPLAIGLALTLIHLISIPVTNTSVNPARSTGPALFAGGWALAQLWLFWAAPLVGGAIGGLVYRHLLEGAPHTAGQPRPSLALVDVPAEGGLSSR
jgi:aquaporin Z